MVAYDRNARSILKAQAISAAGRAEESASGHEECFKKRGSCGKRLEGGNGTGGKTVKGPMGTFIGLLSKIPGE